MNTKEALEIQEWYLRWKKNEVMMVKYTTDEIMESSSVLIMEVKNLSLPNINKQRELLIAYHRFLAEEISFDGNELWVDDFLKDSN